MLNLKTPAIILVLGLTIALNPLKSYAQQADFELKPSRLDIMIRPDEKLKMTFKITNYGDPQTYIPKIVNAAPDTIRGNLEVSKVIATPITFTFENGRRDAGDAVFIKSNESVSIPVTMQSAAGAEQDYYYFFVAEAQAPAATPGKTAVLLSPQIAAPIIVSLTNTGERDAKGAISVFKVNADLSFNLFGTRYEFVESGRSVPVTLMVSNTGSNVINPEGKISVKGPIGPAIEYPVLKRNIYAQSARLMLTPSTSKRYCSRRDSCSRFSILLSGFMVGKYNLSASMDVSPDTAKSFKSVSFIAFPFKPALALGLFLVLYMFLHHRTKVVRRKKG